MKQLFLWLALASCACGANLPKQWQIEDKALMDYFRRETHSLSEKCLADVNSAADWNERAPKFREQLAEMLSLSPMPPRTELNATVTKRLEHDTFTIENLHFQSRPGLYVTANLYVPKNLTKPAPTILYVCGHGPFITNGISYGTKASYQHWGSWFARNGYVCLIIDTLESGEILGNHHGTYRDGLWWWNSRGYTPAGVETWNGMRALDYLSTRPEVDTNRIGITGRSGGGAYSWFITAMDDRIRAAAPTAGITDLENYVVDGAVEGHCDCMFFVNTYRWDYPQLAALAAPRPLLICNTDGDNIFPLDGVVRLRDKVKRIYDLLGKGTNCGLVITPGPHKDTQELQVPVMRWFNRYLKEEESLIETAATKLFSPQQLKVFDTLPGDAVNAKIDETFVELAKPTLPKSNEDWSKVRDEWLTGLRAKSFPSLARTDESTATFVYNPVNGHHQWTFNASGAHLFVATRADEKAERVILTAEFLKMGGRLAPHTPGAWHGQISFPHLDTNALLYPKRIASAPVEKVDIALLVRKEVQLRRRHMLLGETADSQRVADLVRAIRAIRGSPELGRLTLRLEAEGDMAVNALYASLFAPVDELVLTNLPKSHMAGPDYLNVLRILDIPQALAMASERCRVELRGAKKEDWQWAIQTARNCGFEKNLNIVR